MIDTKKLREETRSLPAAPWRACHQETGGCQCGMVWCLSDDALVGVCHTLEDVPGYARDQYARISTAIVTMRNAWDELLNEVEWLRLGGPQPNTNDDGWVLNFKTWLSPGVPRIGLTRHSESNSWSVECPGAGMKDTMLGSCNDISVKSAKEKAVQMVANHLKKCLEGISK